MLINRDEALNITEGAEHICRAAIANGDATTRDGWRKALDVALDCSEALRALPVSDGWEEPVRNILALAMKAQAEGGPNGILASIEGFARAALGPLPAPPTIE